MSHVTRAPIQCVDCSAVFTPPRPGPFKRCLGCRSGAQRRAGQKWRAANPSQPAPLFRPCRSCGTPVPRSGKVYALYCSDGCKPKCSVVGCEDPARKKTWCAAHYSQWRYLGEVRPFSYSRSKPGACIVCQAPTGVTPGMNKYCSRRCMAYWHFHGGNLPASAACAHCHKEIPVGKVEGRARRRRCDIKVCRRCRVDLRKYGTSVHQLATRDGARCRLCGEPVDMAKRAPDPGCPSGDHRVPQARGGTNDPANLQLAHLVCNIRKHDSMPM